MVLQDLLLPTNIGHKTFLQRLFFPVGQSFVRLCGLGRRIEPTLGQCLCHDVWWLYRRWSRVVSTSMWPETQKDSQIRISYRHHRSQGTQVQAFAGQVDLCILSGFLNISVISQPKWLKFSLQAHFEMFGHTKFWLSITCTFRVIKLLEFTK